MNSRNFTNILIGVLVFFFTIPYAKGQHRITEVQFSDTIERVIIREYEYPSTISYIEIADSHFFTLADENMLAYSAAISSDIFVLDFVIHEQYVYFCGFRKKNTTRGIWGWFDVNDIHSGTLNYYTYEEFGCAPQYVDTLHSLSIHEEEDGFHVAMVGANTDGGTTQRWCFIDIWGTPGSETGWEYEMGIPICNNHPCDRMTHICTTDNYIVVAGNYIYPAHSETYRIHMRNNLFSGSQDTIYIYPLHNDGYIHDGIHFALTHVEGDLIAVANKAYRYTSSSQTNRILVNVYDMTQTLTVAGASPVYTMCTNININPIGYSIRDLRYSASRTVLHLLMSGSSLPNTSLPGSIIAELPLPPTSGIASFTTIEDRILLSLDNYNGQNNLLSLGYDNADPAKLNYVTQPLQTATQCGIQSIVRFSSNGYSAKKDYSPYTTCKHTFECKSHECNVTMKRNNQICP